jgi:hypothetical protein
VNHWGIEVTPRSYRDVELAAAAVRRQLEIAPTQPIAGIQLFECLDNCAVVVSGERIPLDYAVEATRRGVEAQTQFEPDRGCITVTLSPESYEMLRIDNPRARFSLCHEIGHAALHCRELLGMACMPLIGPSLARERGIRPETFRDSEWQAESFGAALLMPAQGLDVLSGQVARLDAEILQDTYIVSAAAAEARLKVFTARRWQLLD